MTRIYRVVCGCVLCFAAMTLAANKPDYSGTYTAQQKDAKAGTSKPPVIRVTQTDANIEISRTEGEKTVTNRLPLDGSEVDYFTRSGLRGKGRVQFKGEDLLIEWSVITLGGGDSKGLRLHTKEKWKLSTDKRILTIKSEVDFPDFPPSVTAAALPNNPSTERYERSE
jgi:hypothetical protein